MGDTTPARQCPRCGANTVADTSEGLCPACLPALAALGPLTAESPTQLSELHHTSQLQTQLTVGQMFGPYRIERLLGRGGMGAVYEAEHIEQGRRVAVKVLNQRLGSTTDRARFLREGRLAAAINHPHSVYIFGSEEIDGTPTIAMELLPGGTLKDRVQEQGPLPPAQAVDAILQVIAGLEVLQAVGVLHRDIKPANCFADRDGTVKVGDFGLSISTIARDVSQLTVAGTVQGTPQFASPEQLKGESLDVRSDIYAVGATLYYLLTGRPPFDDANLLALVARIATEAPSSPRALMPHVPRGLANVVLSCLAKDRAKRPNSYAALHEALLPFSSATTTPATIGLRFIAGAIDAAIVATPFFLFNVRQSLDILTRDVAVQGFSPLLWGLFIIQIAIRVGYYGILEGVWGASLGKRLLGLRVVIASSAQSPGVARASWRALLFLTPSIMNALPGFFLNQARIFELSSGPWRFFPLVWTLVTTVLIFSTARRRNGFAAVHELWSGTRVIHQSQRRQQASLGPALESTTGVDTPPRRLGPFEVIRTLGPTATGTLSVGFDPRLRRRVWLLELPRGTPAVPPLIRDLSRPGRLRWLGDGRTATERWDAYEALDGMPLITLLDRPQRWRDVRQWLADLAQEMDAGLSDGSLGRLALDCVWITRESRAKLLDFQVPGAPVASGPIAPATPQTVQTFLNEVATSALTGSSTFSSDRGRRLRHSLPFSATALLDALHYPSGNCSEMVQRITVLLKGPDHVERWRRAASIGLVSALPLGLIAFMAGMSLMIRPMMSAMMTPDSERLLFVLSEVSLPSTSRDPLRLEALETYIAGRFGPMMADPKFGTTPQTVLFAQHRRQIARIVADHPVVSPEQMAAATAVLEPSFESAKASSQSLNPWTLAVLMLPFMFAITAIAAVVSAWLFRGGFLLQAFDIIVVTKNGRQVSRLRALWRGLAAWGVFLAPQFFMFVGPNWLASYVRPGSTGVAIGVCIIGLAGAVWTIVSPERGLQDRIAGTYLVPR